MTQAADQDRNSTPSRQHRAALLCIVVLGMLVANRGAKLWTQGIENPSIDYFNYWVAGQVIREGWDAELYSQEGRRQIGSRVWREAAAPDADPRFRAVASLWQRSGRVLTTGTPFFYSLYSVAGTRSYSRGLILHQATSLLCLVVFVFALGKLLRQRTVFVLAVLLLAFELSGVGIDTSMANCNRLQLGPLLAIALLWWKRHYLIMGTAMGLLVAFKPNIAVVAVTVLLVLATRKMWTHLIRTIAGATLGGVVALTTSALAFDSLTPWWSWIQIIIEGEYHYRLDKGNVSPVLLFESLTGIDLGAFAIVVGLGAVALAARRGSLALGSHAPTPRFELAVVGAGCLIGLLAMKLVWVHYYTLAIPALLAVLLRDSERESPIRLVLVAFAVLGVWCKPLVDVGLISDFKAYAGVFAAGGTLLLGLSVAEIARQAVPPGRSIGQLSDPGAQTSFDASQHPARQESVDSNWPGSAS